MPDSDGTSRRSSTEETTKKLLDAAAEVFVEQGYDKAVVSDIARRAGVTTGAIYARWVNKSDMMAAAVDHIFEQILPEKRLEELGITEWPVTDIFSAWATNLLRGDETQDVLVQVFASSRNNEAVQERLQQFLGEQADQLTRLVERGIAELPKSPDVSIVATVLLIQAVGIGTHLLLAAGREDRHIPTEEAWFHIVDHLLEASIAYAQRQES